MMLHLDPGAVDMSAAPRDMSRPSTPFTLTRRPGPEGTFSASGAWGDATLATREKGGTLVDALVSDVPGNNYVFFRFAGGAATEWRRSLRAAMIEAILGHYGFHVDRRGDLVNAWFKKARAADTEERLDILGRLMACTSQLDMYMTSTEVMRWYVRQFLEGNYSFLDPTAPDAAGPAGAPGG